MSKKRVFISFAIEDRHLRDLLIGQSRNHQSPFEFVDMSVKEPWNFQWKSNCRTKIKGCDGLLAIITKLTKNAEGQLWEIKCAKEENIPHRGIRGNPDDKTTTVENIRITNWTWENIANWIDSI